MSEDDIRNLMRNLRTERFFREVTVNGRKASAGGPIKTFPLRGIKDSPSVLRRSIRVA